MEYFSLTSTCLFISVVPFVLHIQCVSGTATSQQPIDIFLTIFLIKPVVKRLDRVLDKKKARGWPGLKFQDHPCRGA